MACPQTHTPGQTLAATILSAAANARHAAPTHCTVQAVVAESLAKCLPEVPVEVGVDNGVEGGVEVPWKITRGRHTCK